MWSELPRVCLASFDIMEEAFLMSTKLCGGFGSGLLQVIDSEPSAHPAILHCKFWATAQVTGVHLPASKLLPCNSPRVIAQAGIGYPLGPGGCQIFNNMGWWEQVGFGMFNNMGRWVMWIVAAGLGYTSTIITPYSSSAAFAEVCVVFFDVSRRFVLCVSCIADCIRF